MNRGNCATCRFWATDDYPQQEGEVQMGECRRRAPLLIALKPEDAPFRVWPTTRDWDWCGDFESMSPRKEQP
jgi:hypothetical protein